MCGIAGFVSKKEYLKRIEDIDCMLYAQRHRGPDDYGIASFSFSSKGFEVAKPSHDLLNKNKVQGVIGHNRLSILDLSHSGHQPMISSDGKVAIIYNGEVYNAFRYKESLEKEGYIFHSNTDTEIILNLYLKYGIENMLQMLNGMFAFCIVDLGKRKIYWARDRVGIKPLYYCDSEEEFVFASELKSLLQRKTVKKEIDFDAVEEYLSFRSCCADTLLKNVYQVKPGEYLEMDSLFKLRKVKWFDINKYSRIGKKVKYVDLINKAVNAQMLSDVKVGCQLSGGIDSSLVSYYAKKTGYDDAVSIIFDDSSYSEEDYIDHVTEKLKIKSHKIKLDVDYIIHNWERMTWHMDTIVNHPNTMGIMALAEDSKNYVTVLLSGEGADETAGGYSNSMLAYLFDLSKVNFFFNLLLRVKRKKDFDTYHLDKSLFFIESHGYTDETSLSKCLLKRGNGSYREKRKKRIEEYSGSNFDKMLKYDIEFYLPELLMRQDKMTMASSIENRVPLLDNEIIDYLMQCKKKELIGWKKPHEISLKLSNFMTGKKNMKLLSEKIYGTKFTYSRKRGFALPLKDLFLDKRFIKYINEQLIPSMSKRGIINSQYVKSCLEKIDDLNSSKIEFLWRLLSFETWCQLFIDGRAWNYL